MEIEKVKKNNFINVQSIKLTKLKITFNVTTLDMIIAFIYKDSVLRTRKTLSNIYKLMDIMDESLYKENEECFWSKNNIISTKNR